MPEKAENMVHANAEVEKILTTKRKRGEYSHYDSEQRAKMARYAVEHGVARIAKYFSEKLRKNVNESTVRSLKKQYLKLSKEIDSGSVTDDVDSGSTSDDVDSGNTSGDVDSGSTSDDVDSGSTSDDVDSGSTSDDVDSSGAIKVMDRKPRGPPTLLGKYEKEVVDYIQSLCLSGGMVNRPIVIVTARGIVINKEKSLLSNFGSPIDLSKSWAQSFLGRLGYVKRKGTKAARKVPDDFEFIKMEFLSEIQKSVKTCDIPDDLIINQCNDYTCRRLHFR
jgi:hypothetical protein